MFDTLILRDVERPDRVFDLVEMSKDWYAGSGKSINYRNIRVGVERECRKRSHKEDVTLDEIYELMTEEFRKKYGDEAERIAGELKELEIKTELEVCRADPWMKKLYEKLLDQGKRVVITSDMYLPETVMEEILAKCGYYRKIEDRNGYEKLYVSSEYGLTKRSGRLFNVLIQDLGSDSREIVHIGDNPVSDYIRARQAGIGAILVRR